jgi:hypothetical protein
MKIFSLALVIIGILALIYGGIGYNRQRTILDVGGIKATATEHKSIPVPPLVGAIALIGGGALLVVDRRRASPAKA